MDLNLKSMCRFPQVWLNDGAAWKSDSSRIVVPYTGGTYFLEVAGIHSNARGHITLVRNSNNTDDTLTDLWFDTYTAGTTRSRSLIVNLYNADVLTVNYVNLTSPDFLTASGKLSFCGFIIYPH